MIFGLLLGEKFDWILYFFSKIIEAIIPSQMGGIIWKPVAK